MDKVWTALWGRYSNASLFLARDFSPLDGQRLGISRFVEKSGSAGPADAVLHINRVRRAVAETRPSRSRMN